MGADAGVESAMAAKHYTATVEADGSLRMPQVEFEPGTTVEILVFPAGEGEPGLPDAMVAALLAEDVLRREWDDPEEDEAWRDL